MQSPIAFYAYFMNKASGGFSLTLGVNVVKTPETNFKASYDECMGSA